MPASTSRLSYRDCYELFDKALADSEGIRIKAKDGNYANWLKSRLHYARKLDREDNRLVYEEGDPLHGRSMYDPIIIGIRKTGASWWIHLQRVDALNYEVESLSNGNPESASSDHRPPQREEAKEARIISHISTRIDELAVGKAKERRRA